MTPDNPIENGGPAFPSTEEHGCNSGWAGMSLRDYFIAHAPAEPQPWFTPVVPEGPVVPMSFDAPESIREELRLYDCTGWVELRELSPAAREWHEKREAARKACDGYRRECQKQRYVQWPAAWADEMLKARGAA